MTFTVVTLYTPNIASYGKFSSEANQKYSIQHGYNFVGYSDTLDSSRPPAWSKLLAVKNNLLNCDWCFWIDADAVICNREIELNFFIPQNEESCIVLAVTGATNSGSMLIRNCPDSFKIIDMMWNHTSTLNNRVWDDGAAHVLQKRDPWFKSRFFIDNRIQSVYKNFRKGDFVCHMMGECRHLRDKIIPRLSIGDISFFH